MALPSKLTSPLSTQGVDNPDLSAQVNIDLNSQTITNPGATATIDPTQGSLIAVNTTTVGTTLALTAAPQGSLRTGQRVTVLFNSSGVTPTIAAGSGVHFGAAAPALTQNKVTVLELRYDGTELKLVAATTLS